jgi:hypothetical protein
MMRMLLVLAGAASIVSAAVLALALPAATGADSFARVTDCGWWGGGSAWTRRPPQGFAVHLTTRNVRCVFARRFMRHYRGTDTYYPTWTCREINVYESSDVRCVSRGRVIRWVGGD